MPGKYNYPEYPLYGIQLSELEKYMPYLIDRSRSDFIEYIPRKNRQNRKPNRNEYYCNLCNKTLLCNDSYDKHIASKQHFFNINKLGALRGANIQQYLWRNDDYIDVSYRNYINVEAITVKDIDKKVNENFLCPISHEIMTEPVLAADGNTYDRKNIEKWLEIKSTSPLTNNYMDTCLTPNLLICKLINEAVNENQ